jgi:hypothetical protein
MTLAIAQETYNGTTKTLTRGRLSGRPELDGHPISPLDALAFAIENKATSPHLIALWDDIYQDILQQEVDTRLVSYLWAYADETIKARWQAGEKHPSLKTLKALVAKVVLRLGKEPSAKWPARINPIREAEGIHIDGPMFRALILGELKSRV